MTVSSLHEQTNKTTKSAISDDEWLLDLLHGSGWRFRKRWCLSERKLARQGLAAAHLMYNAEKEAV